MKNFKVLYSFECKSCGSNFASIVVKADNILSAYDKAMYIICTDFSEDFNYTVIEITMI